MTKKEGDTFSIPGSENSISTSCSRTHDNSFFAYCNPAPNFQLTDFCQNQNVPMRKKNHLLVKMAGKINGQPIPQNDYKLHTTMTITRDDGSKFQMEKLRIQNNQMKQTIASLESAVTKLKEEKSKRDRCGYDQMQGSMVSLLRAKLGQKQSQSARLSDSLSEQKSNMIKLQVQLDKERQRCQNLNFQFAQVKSQNNYLNSLTSQLQQHREQLSFQIQAQKQQLLKNTVICNQAQAVQEQLCQLRLQVSVSKQSIVIVQKQNQLLKSSLAQPTPVYQTNSIKQFQQQIIDLQSRCTYAELIINQQNEDIMKFTLQALNDTFQH